VGLHELGHDLVLLLQLGFELLDLVLLSVVGRPSLAAVGEGEVTVLEELFEPVVELVRVELILIA
jgi:hypothetical protein